MKKILALLSLIIFANSAFAVQATVPRASKEMNDICYPIINTNHTNYEVLRCLRDAAKNPNIWRSGWTTPVKADVIPLYAGFKYDANSRQNETEYGEVYSQLLYRTYDTFLKNFKAGNIPEEKLTPQEVRKFKGI